MKIPMVVRYGCVGGCEVLGGMWIEVSRGLMLTVNSGDKKNIFGTGVSGSDSVENDHVATETTEQAKCF